MPLTPVDEMLDHLDHEYNQSIVSVRHLFTSGQFNTYEKQLIARKIHQKLSSMLKEVEVYL